jgi:hypothetical protein
MPDIVVATPGRMIDHLRNSMSVDLEDLAVLILDEADRLLELGFSAEIQELVFSPFNAKGSKIEYAALFFVCSDLFNISSSHLWFIKRSVYVREEGRPCYFQLQ